MLFCNLFLFLCIFTDLCVYIYVCDVLFKNCIDHLLWMDHNEFNQTLRLCVFPDGLTGKEPACNTRDAGSILGSWRSPGGGHGNPLQLFLPGKLHGQRSLAGYGSWVAKSWTRLKWLNTAQHTAVRLLGLSWWLSGKESTCNAGDACLNLGQKDPLEKEMATHSSVLT